MEVPAILSFGKKMCSLALVFSIVFMLLGFLAPARTAALYVFLGIWPFVLAVVTWLRMLAEKEPSILGRALIHGGWIWASFGLAIVLLVASPYFASGVPIYGVALAFLVGVLLLILGLYGLVWTNRRTGVPISI